MADAVSDSSGSRGGRWNVSALLFVVSHCRHDAARAGKQPLLSSRFQGHLLFGTRVRCVYRGITSDGGGRTAHFPATPACRITGEPPPPALHGEHFLSLSETSCRRWRPWTVHRDDRRAESKAAAALCVTESSSGPVYYRDDRLVESKAAAARCVRRRSPRRVESTGAAQCVPVRAAAGRSVLAMA